MYWEDIKKIHKSLIKISKSSYERLRKELLKKFILLMDNPYIYQSIGKNENNRRFIIQKYIVFYKIENHKIIVLRLLPQKVNYNQKGIYRIKSKKQLEFNSRKW